MKKNWRLFVVLIVAAAIILLAVLALAPQVTKDSNDSSQPALGQWQSVSAQSQIQQILTVGKLLPVQMIEITSPAAGNLADMGVTWGDSVDKGQVLGRISSSELAAQVRTAQAGQLRSELQNEMMKAKVEPSEVLNARRRQLSAQTSLKTAQTRQQESNILYSKGFVSRNEDEAAKVEVQNAEQQLALAEEELQAAVRKYSPAQLRAHRLEEANKQAELTQLYSRQKQLTLTAPLAGVVLYPTTQDSRGEQSTRALTVGARVTAGESLMAIGDTSSFVIRGYCTEAEYAWLEVGADVEITSAVLPDQTFVAKVSKVLGQARSRRDGGYGEDAAYEFQVNFIPPQLPEAQRRKLRVGSGVKLKVSQPSSTRQTSIPLTAVQWAVDGTAQVLWRASATEAPIKKPIRIIRSGLGDVLVGDMLTGEVWVPSALQNKESESTSNIKKMFGFEE